MSPFCRVSVCYNQLMNRVKTCCQTFYQKTIAPLFQDAESNRLLLYFLLISLIFFGFFIKPDFATDTYADLMLPAEEIITNFLQGGRFITVFFFIIFRGLHVDFRIVSVLSFILAILSLTFALWLLEKFLHKHLVKNRTWAFFLSLLIILNPFIIELFLFVEKGIMVFGILLCVIAASCYANYLAHHQRSSLIWTFALNILAACCYQGIVGLFIVLATLVTVANFKTWKTFFTNTILSVVIYAAGPVINILLAKLFSTGGRIGGEIILGESIVKLFDGSKNMFRLFGIMPSAVFWGLIVVALLCWLIFKIKNRQLLRPQSLFFVAQILYLTAVAVLAALAPQIVQQTASIWVVSRSTYVFASLAGIILTLLLHSAPRISAFRPLQVVLTLSISVFLIVQFASFANITLDHYGTNETDRLRAEQLGQIISDYETVTNTTVVNIMPAKDKTITASYPGFFASGDINGSAFSTPWSDTTSVGYWNGRRFNRLEPTSEWSDYCAAHDWYSSDEAQIKFKDDTLYICWY